MDALAVDTDPDAAREPARLRGPEVRLGDVRPRHMNWPEEGADAIRGSRPTTEPARIGAHHGPGALFSPWAGLHDRIASASRWRCVRAHPSLLARAVGERAATCRGFALVSAVPRGPCLLLDEAGPPIRSPRLEGFRAERAPCPAWRLFWEPPSPMRSSARALLGRSHRTSVPHRVRTRSSAYRDDLPNPPSTNLFRVPAGQPGWAKAAVELRFARGGQRRNQEAAETSTRTTGALKLGGGGEQAIVIDASRGVTARSSVDGYKTRKEARPPGPCLPEWRQPAKGSTCLCHPSVPPTIGVEWVQLVDRDSTICVRARDAINNRDASTAFPYPA